MQVTPHRLGILVALAVSTSSCSTYRNTTRHRTSPHFADSEAMEPGLARKNYVEAHYKQFLAAGRAPNADLARAVAGLDWDSHEVNRQDPSTASQTWSSDDVRKREQQQFESDLAKMKTR